MDTIHVYAEHPRSGIIHLVVSDAMVTLPLPRTRCGKIVQTTWQMGDETINGIASNCKQCQSALRAAALHRPQYWLLDGGGGLYLNPTNNGWSVDVWSFDQELAHAKGGPVLPPIHHAFYKSHKDAMADCDSWTKWEYR